MSNRTLHLGKGSSRAAQLFVTAVDIPQHMIVPLLKHLGIRRRCASPLGPRSIEESAFENDSLALIAYAITGCLPPMKDIRFSNAPRLIPSLVDYDR
jgi:hypothetical protein